MYQDNSVGQGKASVPRPASAVEEALGVLEGTINGLGVVADQLETRLASVISPEPSKTPEDCAKGGSAIPLAMSVISQTDRLRNITDRLQSVLSRLGV